MNNLRTPLNARTHAVLPAQVPPPVVQSPEMKVDGFLGNPRVLANSNPNIVQAAQVTAAQNSMELFLASLRGTERNAMLQVLRQVPRHNLTLIRVIEYIWKIQAPVPTISNRTADSLQGHVMNVLRQMFLATNPDGKLQAMIFVRAILTKTDRFRRMRQETDGIPANFAEILVNLLTWFDPLGPIFNVTFEGHPDTLDEAELFVGLKDIIVDVIRLLPFNARWWLLASRGVDTFLMTKYLEFGTSARALNMSVAGAVQWCHAREAIEEIRAATNGYDRMGKF